MNIAFYIDEMNFRGVANSTFQYAFYNEKILKNKSIIFYNKNNYRNNKEVIHKFKKKFKINSISSFKEIDNYKKKYSIDFLYTQKSGNKDNWISNEIKTLVHSVYPQKINQIHGHNYAYVSEWLSHEFSNKKIPFIPYIVENKKTKNNLKKKLKINHDKVIIGYHGGESSFDINFAQSALLNIVKKRKDIIFLFLNINKFCNHPQIIFLKGTTNEIYKKSFINTCDAMIYARSLGESFGLACGEFAIHNKDIISYRFNRHKSHKYNTNNKYYIEYDSYKSLCSILLNYKKKNKIQNNKYKNYSNKKIMDIFKKVFLSKKKVIKITNIDRLINYYNYLKNELLLFKIQNL
ncbi:hypothetical protein OAR56_01515 [Pelagibacteraceae bacterium]|nr:hypothetical protein [Pelagibacteraceae bacterium]